MAVHVSCWMRPSMQASLKYAQVFMKMCAAACLLRTGQSQPLKVVVVLVQIFDAWMEQIY